MTDPITNILTATKLATGADPTPVDRLKVAEARRVAAILMREQRGMSIPEIQAALGMGRTTIADATRAGARPQRVAEAVRQAKKLLTGATP